MTNNKKSADPGVSASERKDLRSREAREAGSKQAQQRGHQLRWPTPHVGCLGPLAVIGGGSSPAGSLRTAPAWTRPAATRGSVVDCANLSSAAEPDVYENGSRTRI